jgi:hypothetical protein
MTIRHASCRCGQLSAECSGDPVRSSVCHCLVCKQRTGSAFGAQARFTHDQVKVSGTSKSWTRTADSGNKVTYHFCPECGSTVHYSGERFAGLTIVPVGAFADPKFPPPRHSIYENRKCDWVELTGDEIEHLPYM